jgi:KipI family sensor histidine kinase inhibitor
VNVSIERLGEAALVAAVTAGPSLDVARQLWSLAREARAWAGVTDAICGDGNLTLAVDPDRADFPRLEELLHVACAASAAQPATPVREIVIPVAYGGDAGPDLGAVAEHAGRSEREIVDMHCAGDYVVLFLGFLPGFAYLGGLDARLAVPRRRDPRSAIPAGTVAIGGAMTGVYPFRSPGGWLAIGRTAAALFDANRQPAALLAPGDRVAFVPLR